MTEDKKQIFEDNTIENLNLKKLMISIGNGFLLEFVMIKLLTIERVTEILEMLIMLLKVFGDLFIIL